MHRHSINLAGLARISFVALVTLAVSTDSALQPVQSKAADQDRTAAEEFEALTKVQREARDKFSRAYSAAKTEQERQQVLKELGTAAAPETYTQSYLKFVQDHPDDPVVFKAFNWLLTYHRKNEATNKAAAILAKHHSGNEQMTAVCMDVKRHPCAAGEMLMRALLEKSPHRAVQGYARFSLAGCLQHRCEGLIRDDAAQERERLNQESDKLLEQVVKEYADLTHGESTLGKAAAVNGSNSRLSIGCK
jgi:hypothetical protein